jgi:ATPase subunit of ABC transporter with duplicated ATPase domains
MRTVRQGILGYEDGTALEQTENGDEIETMSKEEKNTKLKQANKRKAKIEKHLKWAAGEKKAARAFFEHFIPTGEDVTECMTQDSTAHMIDDEGYYVEEDPQNWDSAWLDERIYIVLLLLHYQ